MNQLFDCGSNIARSMFGDGASFVCRNTDGGNGGIARIPYQKMPGAIIVGMGVSFPRHPVHQVSAEYPFGVRLMALYIRRYFLVLFVKNGRCPFVFFYLI